MKGDETRRPDGQLRILFVGLAQSTHTHSWIDLFKGKDLDLRLFGVDGTVAPPDFGVPTDSTGFRRPAGFALSMALRLVRRALTKWSFRLTTDANFLSRALGFMARLTGNPGFWFEYAEDEWIADIVRRWKPDVIHSLGLEPASLRINHVRSKYGLREPVWVVTARGGPELALRRLMPEEHAKIAEILKECDGFIADNSANLEYAVEMGLDPSKIIPGGIVPGAGGVDAESLSALRRTKPSHQRVILWPKAYECIASKSLPVLEAFKLAWSRIAPCTIHLTATDAETVQWVRALPEEIRSSCVVHERIPHARLLELMALSRVLLAPSVIDGIPNTLYEAMATGAFPIFSPLETFRSVVEKGENILFARNLYPVEIAAALIRSMSDDVLVDVAMETNLELVRTLASRSTTSKRAVDFYRSLLPGKRRGLACASKIVVPRA